MQRLILTVWIVAFASAISIAQTASIATYNIRNPNPGDGPNFWPHRTVAVAAFMSQHDIIGLQEAKFSQLADLDPKLAEYKRYSVGRDDGGKSGETTTIYFRENRFNLKSKGTIWLSAQSGVPGSKGWDAALPRILSWVVLTDKKTAQDWLVANTHFDHRGKIAREKSGELIQQFLAKKNAELGAKLPVVLLGDFNCMIDSKPYQNIINDTSDFVLKDARKVTDAAPLGPNSTWCGFTKIAEGRIIDHVFVAGPVNVLQLRTHDPKTKNGRFASDHLPVSVTVQPSL